MMANKLHQLFVISSVLQMSRSNLGGTMSGAKRIIICAVIFACVFANVVQAEQQTYYYYFKDRINLELLSDQLAVQFQPGSDPDAAVLLARSNVPVAEQKDIGLQQWRIPEWPIHRLIVIQV